MSDAPINPDRTDRSPDGHQKPATDKLTELKYLLVDPKGVSHVLPEAIELSASQDDTLAIASMPTVEQAIKTSVVRDQGVLSDALFPIMGPAIRKAVSAALDNLVQVMNQSLEHSLSPQSFLWRLEARRAGKSFAEIVLLRNLLYQVEQVLLIHKAKGLLLQQIMAKSAIAKDPDLVSAMLTAVQDFVKDSFNVPGDYLNTLQLEDFTIWIEESPYAVLACVIRGHAPQELRVTMKQTLERIHRTQQDKLKRFDGDNAPFEVCKPDLELCLQSQYKDPPTSKPSPLLLGIAGVILLGLCFWGFRDWQARQRWSTAIKTLNQQPGIIVTQSKQEWGTFSLVGLRDPLAAKPNTILEAADIDPQSVKASWEPYLSFHPDFVAERAKGFLKSPDTVDFKMDDNQILSAIGGGSPVLDRSCPGTRATDARGRSI